MTVDADLSRIPNGAFPQKRGKDGKIYYEVNYEIEITFLSAFTKYELIHNGVNYGAVHAEYV